MKQIIVIILIVNGIFLSYKNIKYIKTKTNTLKQCVLMFENIELMLKYNILSTKEIYYKLIITKNYRNILFLKSFLHAIEENRFNDDFIMEEIKKKKNSKYFDYDDLDNLESFFINFGTSDVNSQISNCSFYKNIFTKKLTKQENIENEKIKTTTALIYAFTIIFIIIIL